MEEGQVWGSDCCDGALVRGFFGQEALTLQEMILYLSEMPNHSTGKAELTLLIKYVISAVLCVTCPGKIQCIAYSSSEVSNTKSIV